jgi:hypothetical protein
MRRSHVVLGVLLTCVASVDAAAQTRQLEGRIDSLARVALRARTALQAYDDSARTAFRALDTVHTGIPVVVAERAIAPLTRAIAPRVVDSVSATLGAVVARLAGHTLRAQIDPDRDWVRPSGPDTPGGLIVTIVRPNGAQMRAWRSPLDTANIVALLHHALTYAVFAMSDPGFFAWAGNRIPDDTIRVSEWANHRLMLISSPTAVGRRCYGGDLPACRSALLLSADADPVMDWHDSTTRRRLVRTQGAMARRLDAPAARQCQAGSDADCIALLRLFPSGTLKDPTGVALRFGLLRHALAIGGQGSVQRLLAAPAADPTGRLEAAAGAPIDSVIRQWQARVRRTRAPSEDLTIGIAIMSLVWATGIGAMSLRSSRWR